MRAWLIVVTLLPGAALSADCGRNQPAAQLSAPTDRPNVLLITIDTLRADRLGCYGYRNATTPTLDGLAARGVRFPTAVAHTPLTGPSHASILTGLSPLGHGFRNNSGFVLAPTIQTAAEDFKHAGYRTGAVVAGFPLDRRFGFDQGFDVYEDHLPRGNDPRRTPYVERPANATTDAALRWLASAKNDGSTRWFLWVHYYDPHAPYEPPGDLATRYASSLYDGEIAFVDRELGRLLRGLEEQQEVGRTLVVATADHGESLGEHGEGTHGVFVYDATIRVPMIMAGPHIAAGRSSDTVARLIDVLPTMLDYAAVPLRADLDGRSLRPTIEGHAMGDVPAYAESLYAQFELGWAPLHAWRTATAKFIDAPRAELYDLEHDASEVTNVAADHPARAEELRQALEVALRRSAPSASAAVDPEAAERLRALGYVSGGTVPRSTGRPLRDPKDGVRILPRLNRGMSAARVEPETAIRELTAVLADDPDLMMARRTRAVAYAAARRHELAIADLRYLDAHKQLTPEDAIVLGDNLRFAGKVTEAAAVLERTARENPKFPQPLLSLAEVRIQERNYDEAARICERALQLVPDHIEALRRLGDLALLRADLEAAGTRYSRILTLDATDVPALTKLGVVRMRTSKPDDAMQLFHQAIDREPKNAEALLYLAGVLASRGRPSDALPYFERALDAEPHSTMALNGLGLTRLALGDSAGAAEAFRKSLRLDPKQPDIAQALADLRAAPRSR
jgi:arylsulfatase A-like enzyme/Tfp pilus assembly protein PilF